jgi:hypothetical protein
MPMSCSLSNCIRSVQPVNQSASQPVSQSASQLLPLSKRPATLLRRSMGQRVCSHRVPASDSRCTSCCHWRLRRLFKCAGIGRDASSLSGRRALPLASTRSDTVVLPFAVSSPSSSASLSSSIPPTQSIEPCGRINKRYKRRDQLRVAD